MKIILDKRSTKDENWLYGTNSKPTSLEITYDASREEDGDTIVWKLTAEKARMESKNGNVTVTT